MSRSAEPDSVFISPVYGFGRQSTTRFTVRGPALLIGRVGVHEIQRAGMRPEGPDIDGLGKGGARLDEAHQAVVISQHTDLRSLGPLLECSAQAVVRSAASPALSPANRTA